MRLNKASWAPKVLAFVWLGPKALNPKKAPNLPNLPNPKPPKPYNAASQAQHGDAHAPAETGSLEEQQRPSQVQLLVLELVKVSNSHSNNSNNHNSNNNINYNNIRNKKIKNSSKGKGIT